MGAGVSLGRIDISVALRFFDEAVSDRQILEQEQVAGVDDAAAGVAREEVAMIHLADRAAAIIDRGERVGATAELGAKRFAGEPEDVAVVFGDEVDSAGDELLLAEQGDGAEARQADREAIGSRGVCRACQGADLRGRGPRVSAR